MQRDSVYLLGANGRIESGENCYNINQTERKTTMNYEPNKPIEAEELTEKELEGVVGGTKAIVPIIITTSVSVLQPTLGAENA